ncbi:MAG: GTPase Era [Candidatus Azotimanducaceae bacterium]
MSMKSGYVAILGRPNVGKSTLLNALVGQKISITSRKPQTTRQKVIGILTEEEYQVLFVDTPGIHSEKKDALNRFMNRDAKSALVDVDIVVLVFDRGKYKSEDQIVVDCCKHVTAHKIVVVNKIDLLSNPNELFPILKNFQDRFPDATMIPLSAQKEKNLEALIKEIKSRLPESPFYYPEDQITDKSQRFLIAEIIREKIMRQLGKEIPYQTAVVLDTISTESSHLKIDASIFVDKNSQKKIVIGKDGERIKRVSMDARLDIEALLQKKVMLRTWIRVKKGWSHSAKILKSLGFDEGE